MRKSEFIVLTQFLSLVFLYIYILIKSLGFAPHRFRRRESTQPWYALIVAKYRKIRFLKKVGALPWSAYSLGKLEMRNDKGETFKLELFRTFNIGDHGSISLLQMSSKLQRGDNPLIDRSLHFNVSRRCLTARTYKEEILYSYINYQISKKIKQNFRLEEQPTLNMTYEFVNTHHDIYTPDCR